MVRFISYGALQDNEAVGRGAGPIRFVVLARHLPPGAGGSIGEVGVAGHFGVHLGHVHALGYGKRQAVDFGAADDHGFVGAALFGETERAVQAVDYFDAFLPIAAIAGNHDVGAAGIVEVDSAD